MQNQTATLTEDPKPHADADTQAIHFTEKQYNSLGAATAELVEVVKRSGLTF